MNIFLLFSVFFLPFSLSFSFDAHLPLASYLNSYSYPFEEHFVITPDSYILRLFRIKAKLAKKGKEQEMDEDEMKNDFQSDIGDKGEELDKKGTEKTMPLDDKELESLLLNLVGSIQDDNLTKKTSQEKGKNDQETIVKQSGNKKEGNKIKNVTQNNKNEPTNDKKVVFLLHGLADSADNMVVNKEEWAPALYLANRGFDVWLGNLRGNRHSRNHTTLDPDFDKSFWDFGVDEFIMYDVPSMCEYVFNVTKKKMTFIGHSQGSTLMLALLALNHPIILKTVEKHLSFGPVVFLRFARKFPPLNTFLSNSLISFLVNYFESQGGEFFIPDAVKNSLIYAICPSVKGICDAALEAVLQMLIDADPKVDYMRRSDVFMGHYPGGTSIKALIHWYQILQEEEGNIIRKYDYGESENLKRYGEQKPPVYEFKNIGPEVPIYFYIGYFDRLGTKNDILSFAKTLKNANIRARRIYPMGHSSFIWGRELNYFLDDVTDDIMDCSCGRGGAEEKEEVE